MTGTAWAAPFFGRVYARLDQGERDYADASHGREPVDLVDEVQQELEDVSGWSAILWRRLERCRAQMADQAELLRLAELVTRNYLTVSKCEAVGWPSGDMSRLRSVVERLRC